MSLLVRGGEIVSATTRFKGDILCEGDRIVEVAPSIATPAGTTILDASGRLVFPGFIDPHVHIHLPFMGTLAKDTYESASRAALLGGTTTLLEMVCPSRTDDPLAAFDLWMSKAVGHSACDFSFHMGVTKFDENSEAKLRAIVARGIASFKIFLAYKGAFGVNDEELYRTLKLAQQLGVVVLAHCENDTLVAERCRELLAAGRTAPAMHHESRPPEVEAEGVNHLMTFAELTGAEVYIVHLSCAEALERALAARQRGVRVSIETLIQYLVLDMTYAERPNFEGAKFVMSPPLRDARNQAVLWKAIASGEIDTLATDHAPFDFATQKRMGEKDFTKIPNGIPSLEDRIALAYSRGVLPARITLHDLVRVASTNVAKRFGLYPRKGVIEPGADADLVIFDPAHRRVISAATHSMAVDYSAFEGWEVEGRVETVLMRGEVAVRSGKFVGTIGRGQFLARQLPSS